MQEPYFFTSIFRIIPDCALELKESSSLHQSSTVPFGFIAEKTSSKSWF